MYSATVARKVCVQHIIGGLNLAKFMLFDSSSVAPASSRHYILRTRTDIHICPRSLLMLFARFLINQNRSGILWWWVYKNIACPSLWMSVTKRLEHAWYVCIPRDCLTKPAIAVRHCDFYATLLQICRARKSCTNFMILEMEVVWGIAHYPTFTYENCYKQDTYQAHLLSLVLQVIVKY